MAIQKHTITSIHVDDDKEPCKIHTHTHTHTHHPCSETPTSNAVMTTDAESLLGETSTSVDPDHQIRHDSPTNELAQQVRETDRGDQIMDTNELERLPLPTSSSSSVPTQENIVAFAEQYSLDLASKRFDVPIATIKKWVKSSWVPLKPKYNSPGQGRKISYSTDLDSEMAEHIREALSKGEPVSIHSVCFYARSRVQQEVPEFNASTGWANRFLARHNISLTDHKEQRREVVTPKDNRNPDSRGRPLSYSIETDQAIANYVRQKLADRYSLTNSELRRYAKEIIIKENRKFTGSASWAQNFLHRHKINLQNQDPKESAVSNTPSPTVSSHMNPSTSIVSPSTSLLTPASLNSQRPQYVSSSTLSSSPQFTSSVSTVSVANTHLNPATEMHVVASSAQGFSDSSLSDGVMSLPAEYGTDDPMKQALAILTGENLDAGILSAEQIASLQSTLSELTCASDVSLVELLNTAQQIHEQSGSTTAHLITHGLDSPASGLYLGISTNSDVFGSGLTGAAATQVNPNTQTPTVPNPPRTSAAMHSDMDANSSSRPLSYAKETDLLLAKWVQEQQAAGKKVTFASLRAYAKNLVSSENPNFNASVGWVTPFLLRHGLDLSINKKRASRKSGSPHETDMQVDQGSTSLTHQSSTFQKQASTRVHHIMQDEQPLTPEQMMIPPVQVVSSEASIIPTSVMSCPTATLEGLRAALEQGIQNLATDCTQTEQLQFAAQFQEQPIVLGQTPTSLSQVTPDLSHDGMHVVSIDGQVLGEGRAQRAKVPTQKYITHEDEEKISVKRRTKGQRNRHRLSEKLDVVRLMREHSLAPHYVCRMLGIANSTMAGWIKLVQQKGAELEALSLNKKRSNISGQGRPLSYSKEKDEAIAQWVQAQQKLGVQVMPAELAKYAQSLIREENVNFTASSGWSQKFLQRHNLQLVGKSSVGGVASQGTGGTSVDCTKSSPAVVEDQHSIPAAVQTEEVITHEYSQEKPYSEEIEKHLVAWVKENVSVHGSLSLQALCRYAEEVVISQNPMFVASLSWAFMFLYTHKLLLDPKPSVGSVRSTPNQQRKRTNSNHDDSSEHTTPQTDQENTPKKPCPDVSDISVSPSTGNLCEALLALSNQSQESGQPSNNSVQAVLQVALRALHQQQQQQQQQKQLEVQMEGLVGAAELVNGSGTVEVGQGESALVGGDSVSRPVDIVTNDGKDKNKPMKGKGTTAITPVSTEQKDTSSNTYFGKPAREFSVEEKEEVVRYANATTLQKAAMKYGVAAPTVWRWRVELKLHQPKYSAMQKKYIIKFAETNSLKEAAQRYGITGKTISNWRKALQADGELSGDVNTLLTQESQADMIESSSGGDSQSTSEVVFHFIVDGGEVVEVTGTVGNNVQEDRDGTVEQPAQEEPTVQPTEGDVPLEVTNEVDIENVGMEYDVVSSEGHVAKPRCTPQEKLEILQYALDHSIKEASAKFGVSPGTLYYWKRSRNSGKDIGKENSIHQGSVGPDQPAGSTCIPHVVEYSEVIEEPNVLASSSDNIVVQPEQFIASSNGTPDSQTATIQTLSQALAGMNSDALQNLNPDLTLLQAVSSFLTGSSAGGEQGGKEGVGGEGRGGDNDGSDRHDSNSGGISSPTEVLVRPFPPQKELTTLTSNDKEEKTVDNADDKEKGSGQQNNQMEDMPHVVSEEVVMMGSDEHLVPEDKKATEDSSVKDKPEDRSITITVEGETANETGNVPTSSEPGNEDIEHPVELPVLAFPQQPSTLTTGDDINVPLTQSALPSNVNSSSVNQKPNTPLTQNTTSESSIDKPPTVEATNRVGATTEL